LELQLAEAATEGFWLKSVGMGPSASRSLVRIRLKVVGTFDSHGFIHEDLDGLGHGFEAVLGEQLDSFVGGVRLELVGHGSGLLFSVLTKKKPILAHFFKQTDRPSTVRVRSLRSRTRTVLESDEFTEEKLHCPGFLGSKLMEDVGCLADLVAEVDCGKIQITAKMG
jgi:hypothetical protein